MKDRTLNQLFRAAAKDTPPGAAPGFEQLVLAAIREPEVRPETDAGSLFEQLSRLFPRIAGAAAVVMVLCVAADYGLASRAPADLTDSLTELSEQWLFAAN